MAIPVTSFTRSRAEHVYSLLFPKSTPWQELPNSRWNLARNISLLWQKDWLHYSLTHGQEQSKNRVLRIDLPQGFSRQMIATYMNTLFVQYQPEGLLVVPNQVLLEPSTGLNMQAERISGVGFGLLDCSAPVVESIFGVTRNNIPTAIVRCAVVNASWPTEVGRLSPNMSEAEFVLESGSRIIN